ncbi:MAG: aminopeptidase P family protein [Campylobacteraceae bacterium]|nr:aminopeptidase P family protein [Campylobacteraceae bacterium]
MHVLLFLSHAAQMETCGFGCDNAIVLKAPKKIYFITDGRYTTEAKEQVAPNVEVVDGGRSLGKTARLLLRELGASSVSYDPKEWFVADFDILTQNLKRVRFTPKPNLSQKLRTIKPSADLRLIEKAVKVGEKAFDTFVEFIKKEGIGMSEKALHHEALKHFTSSGEHEVSFSPIVAINSNAAKPHALPDETKLQLGDLLLIDAGIKLDGFCSDRTRTVCVSAQMSASKKQFFNNPKQQLVYETVLRAQEAAINIVKPGISANLVDKTARDVIEKAGFGRFFIHSTGHGVGRDIHELPAISSTCKTPLEIGMVFTIEPGIYLPNEFGVRIEDMLVVTKDGARVL